MLVIPGFRGYKAKEQRREADKLIRNFLHARLQEARNGLQDIYQAATENKTSQASLLTIDRITAIFDRVSEKVNHASYGYAGFFDAIKIDEDDLDKMISYDTELMDGAKALAQNVIDFKNEAQSKFDSLQTFGEETRKAIEKFETAFDNRKDAIEEMEVN